MAEQSISRCLLELTLAHAEMAGIRQILSVQVGLSQLSNLSEEALRSSWVKLARGTPAEGAELSFRIIAAVLECEICRSLISFDQGMQIGCPVCGSVQLELQSGDEILIEALDGISTG